MTSGELGRESTGETSTDVSGELMRKLRDVSESSPDITDEVADLGISGAL